MTHADLETFRKELMLALQDALPLDEKDSRPERIMLAIDGLIQLHLAMHKLHEPRQ